MKNYVFQHKNIKGFTLIELLVVISIIGILTAISAFALLGTREAGRDAKRKTDLETIRSALEIYKADCNRYPATLPAVNSPLQGNPSAANCTGTTNTYLQSRPGDPTTGRTYGYRTTGTPPNTYILCAALEEVTTAAAACSGVSCGSGTCSYSITSN